MTNCIKCQYPSLDININIYRYINRAHKYILNIHEVGGYFQRIYVFIFSISCRFHRNRGNCNIAKWTLIGFC